VPIIPALERLRQEDRKVKVSFGYKVRPSLTKPREEKRDRYKNTSILLKPG
jgi:hypothetical protein